MQARIYTRICNLDQRCSQNPREDQRPMNIFQFLSEVKSELFKVVWPTKSETIRYTLTVIIFSIVVSLILGAFDYMLLRLFEAAVNR